MAEYPCPECNGCGQVVTPMVTEADDGTIEVMQVAHMCAGCGGKRVVNR